MLPSVQKVLNSIHVALTVLLTTIPCFGQGQLYFSNRVGSGGSIVNAPVTINGTTQGPGPDYSSQLFLVNPDNSLRPLIPVSNFNAEGLGAASIKNQF